MTQELIAKIDKYQAIYKSIDKSTIAGQKRAIEYEGIIAALKAKLPTPKVALHVDQDLACESCQ